MDFLVRLLLVGLRRGRVLLGSGGLVDGHFQRVIDRDLSRGVVCAPAPEAA
jgi:hypothetical protein